jgi:L-threonylcarbamoyladenylate synthase
MILVEKTADQIEQMKRLAAYHESERRKVGLLVLEEDEAKFPGLTAKVLGSRSDYRTCAANLFGLLRAFDREGAQVILAQGVDEEGLGAAVMDRLRRASGEVVL